MFLGFTFSSAGTETTKSPFARFKAPAVGSIFYCQPVHVQLVGIIVLYAAVVRSMMSSLVILPVLAYHPHHSRVLSNLKMSLWHSDRALQ